MREGLDAEFDALLNDVLSLHKPDGRVFEHIRAYVSVKGILIMDATLPIQTGDVLTRTLPSGVKEDFIVDDPRFQQGILGMPAHFQVKVHPAGADRLPRSSQTEFGIGLYALSDPPALFPGREFPRFVYHATQEPKMVSTAEEETALGPEWSRTYIHQEYPKVKYHWTREPITVKNAKEEADLGGGWANTPAAFDPYKGARPTRTEQQDPTKWLEEWTALGLSSSQRTGIKAQLLRADATFDRSLPDPDSAAVAAMRQAFDGIARVLFEAGILTEQLLKNEIPLFVWDSAIAGGWWRLASDSRQDIFPEQLGHYWVWRDDSRDWKGLFRAEAGEWQALLLETPGRSPEVSDRPDLQHPGKLTSSHNPKVHSSSEVTMGTEASLPTWKDLQTDFLQYAVEHADLRAVWRWMYEDPDESAEPPAPKGQWALEGGSPGSQHLFRVIAGRAATRLSNPSDAEPWRLWLDRMRTEGYARDLPPRRVSMQHIRNLAALGQIGRPLPPGFKNQQIEQVFRASADFCFARSLTEVNTASPSPAADEARNGQTSEVKPAVGGDSAGGEAVAERAARRQAVVNPILKRKRWKQGRLATKAGVGKNSVYDYLDGTRAKITDENRRAIAEALGLKPEELPD